MRDEGTADERGNRSVIPLFPLSTPLFPGVVLPLNIFEPRYRRLVEDLTARPAGPTRRFGVVAIRSGWEVEQVSPAEALFDVGCTAVLRAVSPQPGGGYRVAAVGAERFRLLDVLVGTPLPDDASGQDSDSDDEGPDVDSGGAQPPYLRAVVEWLGEEEAAEEAAGDAEAGGAPPAESFTGLTSEVADGSGEAATGSLTLLADTVRELFARYVTDVAVRRGSGPDELPDAVIDALDPAGADRTGSPRDDARGLSYLVAATALLTTEDRQTLLAESATRRRLALESRLLRRELTLLEVLGAVPLPLAELATPLALN